MRKISFFKVVPSLRCTLPGYLILLFVALGVILPLPVKATSVIDGISEEVNRVFEQSSPAVVRIFSPSRLVPLSGTGFFIDNQGTVLTSISVIGDAFKAIVEYKGKKYDGVVLGLDPRSGIALLRITAGEATPFLTLGDSDKLRTASGLISVAYPYNLPVAPNFGNVAGFDVQYLNCFFATTHIRANLAVSPGQIGGPLLNSREEVVGLMVMAIEQGKGCYALPSRAAKKIIDDIAHYGEARHGWVGVGVVQDERENLTAKPVKISQLFKDTPAESSGLQMGDHVLKIGDREIHKPADILDAAFFSKVGQKIPIDVLRNGVQKQFTIEVRERPSQSRIVAPSKAFVPPSQVQANEPIQVKATLK